MTARSRNVNVDRRAPVALWPLEALRSVLERGDIYDYQEVVHAIYESPWGDVANRVEEVLSWTQPYGVTRIMQRAIDNARSARIKEERAWVIEQLRDAVEQSGMSQAAFACELGTSASRFSTYINGSVIPAATILARARSICQRALTTGTN